MKRTTLTLFVILAVATVGGAATQAEIEGHPGYFALEELGLLDREAIEIDVNLSGAMLRLVSGATEEGDPEFSSLMSGLLRIRVLVGRPSDADSASIASALDDAASRLEADGWQAIVKIRDGYENIRLLVRDSGETIEGLTVLMGDGDEEVVLVNIVGEIDPEALGRLGGVLAGVSGVDDLNITFD